MQTDADREGVLDGLANEASRGESAGDLSDVLEQLQPRWFLVRDAEGGGASCLLQPRRTFSFMREPMTWQEIRRARQGR